MLPRPRISPAIALPVLVCLALLLAGTWALPLLDRDEPRFARATVEMIERGDWIVPWFNGEYRFDKPPLTYWMMAVGYAVAGYGELGARLHSVASAAAVAALLFVLGARMFSAAVGLASALAWATCLQVFVHGRLAVADMPMVLAVLAAHLALWELLLSSREAPDRRWALLLWVALALGFLAKGPIAVASPAITLLLTRVFLGRRGLPWRRLEAIWGLPLALILVGAWGIPALARTGGAFWDVGIGEHVVRRGVESFNDRPVVPFYYLVTVFLSLFPWSPMLGQVTVELRRNWRDHKNRFLLAWILGPFLVFSFYTTQLPHYTMPAFPALLLLMFRRGADPSLFPIASRRFFHGLHAVFGILLLALAGYLVWLPLQGDLSRLRWSLLSLIAVLLSLQWTAVAVVRAAGRARREEGDRPRHGLRPALAGVLAAVVFATLLALTVRPLSASIRLRPHIAGLPEGARLVGRGYSEPSLVFYAGAPWEFGDAPDLEALMAGPDPFLVLYRLDERGLDRLLRPGADAPFPEQTERAAREGGVPRALIDSDLERVRVQGFNWARSTWTDLILFYRAGPPPPSSPGSRRV